MRIAICSHQDYNWGTPEELKAVGRHCGEKVIIDEFNSKETFARRHENVPYNIMICCFEGKQGLETIALAKQFNSNVKLIWVGSDETFSPYGYRIHVVDYIEGPYILDQLRFSIFGEQKVISFPTLRVKKDIFKLGIG